MLQVGRAPVACRGPPASRSFPAVKAPAGRVIRAEVPPMRRWFARFWLTDEEGATAAEYAVMLVLVICAVIASVTAVGNSTAEGWTRNVSQVMTACSGS